MSNPYRGLPSVNKLLQHGALQAVRERFPADRIVTHSRAILERTREAIAENGSNGSPPDLDHLAAAVAASLEASLTPSLRPVVNATGVVLHTNLGRSPLSVAAIAAMEAVSHGYSTLEFDVATGTRGSRHEHLTGMLRELTGAEAVQIVNNNAAALFLSLATLAAPGEVIVSRGQAVEIGGGFRIPDVCRQSGASLVEVGTTNRTRAADYASAVTERTAALLRVHSSNFRIVGFTKETTLGELRAVATTAGALLIDDLGSGCLLDTSRFGLAHEPIPQDSVAAGADVVCFSGDKLLGGPQAGIVVGRKAAVDRMKRHPLARVLRPDKATLAGLAATLRHYLQDEAETAIPIWRMIASPPETLRGRAEAWRSAIGAGAVEAAQSTVGGGSLPGEQVPTFVLALRPADAHGATATDLAARLRRHDPPVIGRIEHEAVLLDPRTVQEEESSNVIDALRDAYWALSHPD